MKFEKTELQKGADYFADNVIKNVETLNKATKIPNRIDLIESELGKRYIALDDIYKLLDYNDRFIVHQEIE